MLNCTAVLLIILLPHLLRGSVSPHCYFCLIFSVGTDLLQSSLLQSGFKDTLIYLIPSFLSEPSNSFWWSCSGWCTEEAERRRKAHI